MPTIHKPVVKVRGGVELPDRMKGLVLDKTRNLPVPFMNVFPDGTYDFISISYEAVQQCVTDSLCGICGGKLRWWSAFIGGPISNVTHIFSDPPMHPECAEMAFKLCPHILIAHAKRATDERAGAAAYTPGAETAKPERWIMGTARTDQTQFRATRNGFHIRAGAWKSVREFTYNDNGKLVEQ